ncbi:tumor necrosis factor ligand superfamily member 12 isoform X1 [Dasypus novemcinctus]|uniref:tumor necrosis factor ligand superfamily member 12 isoform X1 n=1 Tax=Dasypus novemcinctus TaxID=9361 RepID=UPI0003292021|nr:tumor necrosis factor ligand superfamily member 12 isoform X1 [Dasypus novemcinctus]XP_058139563.1 tumor necrosis factor ligand superfamily member 12 isoform X1 [Dasypus novemcinctus]
MSCARASEPAVGHPHPPTRPSPLPAVSSISPPGAMPRSQATFPSPTSGAAPGLLCSGRSSWVSLAALSFLEGLTLDSPETGGEGGRGLGQHWPHRGELGAPDSTPRLLSSSLLFILKFLFICPLRKALLPFCTTARTPILPATSLLAHSGGHSCWQCPQLMSASSPPSLAPKRSPGDRGGPVQELALSVALWLSWGAALGAMACAMALLTQQTELQNLRREVARLQKTAAPLQKGEGYPWQSLPEQSPDDLETWNGERSRRRRAVLTHKQKKRRSVLHLVPINITSKEDSDVTEVMWQPALRRGRGLEAKGYVVRVWDAGVYLLYSQVLFHDVTFTMGQVVSREGQGRQETLFRCVRSMPSNPDRAYNSCYSAGVFHLHQGDILSVVIPRARARFSLSPHGTFLGFVKL